MRIMVWHVHGGWMDGFLRGGHEYLLPAPAAGARPALPAGSRWLEPREFAEQEVDVVVLQRTEELEAAAALLGRRPGIDVPAVFVEHNTPKRLPVTERHPLAGQHRIPVVHVTHFNRLVWDCGEAPTVVIEHGIPDPRARYSGELEALGVVINEPVRRGRVVGTDLLPRFAEEARLDCFGIDTDRLPGALGLGPDRLRVVGDLPTVRLHRELARRRAYLHPMRWTSLGLSLLEAMSIGMPVLVLATTEAGRAVPAEAGVVSADVEELASAARRWMADPDEARERGRAARAFVRTRYGLDRFLADWDALLA
ncbi:glycosyltransferase [Leucobacter massiliensis]|uniref:Glycosyl transferase n=1 Tax=Leucobacter massiliensis TaxID=1686285 RepID=A0A2S9QKA4_9MICO|nr:glycosyltransferase [Leucobacter massiliensis]PRI10016.1 glycosyl transferase [Leucobacter massiliensis]